MITNWGLKELFWIFSISFFIILILHFILRIFGNDSAKSKIGLPSIILALIVGVSSNYLYKVIDTKFIRDMDFYNYSITEKKLEKEFIKLNIRDRKVRNIINTIFDIESNELEVISGIIKLKKMFPKWNSILTSKLATLLLQSGNEEKCILILRKRVLVRDPTHYMANELIGLSYMRLAQKEKSSEKAFRYYIKAKRYFKKNIRNHRNRSLSYFNLGWLYKQMGDSDKSNYYFSEANRIEKSAFSKSFFFGNWFYPVPGVYATEKDHFGIMKKYTKHTISQENLNYIITEKASIDIKKALTKLKLEKMEKLPKNCCKGRNDSCFYGKDHCYYDEYCNSAQDCCGFTENLCNY